MPISQTLANSLCGYKGPLKNGSMYDTINFGLSFFFHLRAWWKQPAPSG